MTPSQVYWLITIPKLGGGVGLILTMIGLIGCVLIPFIFLMQMGTYEIFKWKHVRPYFIASIVMAVVGGIMQVFIPSAKEIVAIYGISYITNNKDLNEIPPKLFEYANVKLDEVLQEAK